MDFHSASPCKLKLWDCSRCVVSLVRSNTVYGAAVLWNSLHVHTPWHHDSGQCVTCNFRSLSLDVCVFNCDRQTDGRTHDDSIYCASRVSRGKITSEKACSRWMTLKVTQGRRNSRYSIELLASSFLQNSMKFSYGLHCCWSDNKTSRFSVYIRTNVMRSFTILMLQLIINYAISIIV